MGLPPIQNPGIFNGQPTCPQGYYYDPASGLCQPIPGSPTVTTIKSTVWGAADGEINGVQAGINQGVGLAKSGWIGQFVASLWYALILAAEVIVKHWVNGYDHIVAFIADFVTAAATRNNPGLWVAIGSLLSDILGINLDGEKLYAQLVTKGTLPAMEAVGGSLLDLLIGEFTGTASGTGGNVSYSTDINPATGLPVATLSPLTGLNGAKALVGFILTSAIRQANIDGFVDAIPFGYGEVFEKFSEGVRTNLGIGRMMRFALKPIFQDLVATPLKWAINKQYTPTLLSPADAFSAHDQKIFDDAALADELAMHGYSAKRWAAIEWRGRSLPTRAELRGLHVTGVLDDATYLLWMRRTGYTDLVTELVDRWEDILPARDAVLKAVSGEASKYLAGKITAVQFQSFVGNMNARIGGGSFLSPGEIASLTSLPSLTPAAAKHKNLSFAGLVFDYEEGLVTLQQVEADLTAAGYDAEQVSELVLRLLVKAKAAAEKAAAAKAKAAAGGTGSTSIPGPTPGASGLVP